MQLWYELETVHPRPGTNHQISIWVRQLVAYQVTWRWNQINWQNHIQQPWKLVGFLVSQHTGNTSNVDRDPYFTSRRGPWHFSLNNQQFLQNSSKIRVQPASDGSRNIRNRECEAYNWKCWFIYCTPWYKTEGNGHYHNYIIEEKISRHLCNMISKSTSPYTTWIYVASSEELKSFKLWKFVRPGN